MKRYLHALLALALALAAPARVRAAPGIPVVDAAAARKAYGATVTVTPMDGSVTVTRQQIVIAPRKEGAEYTISGYFNGQVVNRTKNTVIRLRDAYLENTSGGAALFGEAKTEVSAFRGSVNYIVSSGRSGEKTAALHCKKDLELGGSGTLYVIGGAYHGVKGDDVKMKGSGTFYVSGTQKGSAINCQNFLVEREKAFTAYLVSAKNGIKADGTISIASGTFYIYGAATAFKTDTKEDSPHVPHSVTLSGGTFHLHGNGALHRTEKNSYRAGGARIVEE